ncbi:MAG: hypothetical protein PVF54_10640, partial [Anaerolineae bacterium]
RALTAPGDIVVDLFCQSPTFVREVVEAGRRALGLSINPLLLVSARLGSVRLDSEALNSAFTRLADSLKGEIPLHKHLTSLYRSACPICEIPGVAEWFAWDRDLDYPVEKGVCCQECGEVQIGPADKKDIELARANAPRGLAYYYALNRAAPLGHPARDRAAALVECYTPRNLSALMDLSRRIEDLKADQGAKTALTAMLLDCFDRGSKLYPPGDDRARPRTLRVPPRYLERNIWSLFEKGFSGLVLDQSNSPVPRAEDVARLVNGDMRGYALAPCAARDVGTLVPPESVALILADPPRPDGVFWALSALWAAWIWDSPKAHAMRPFLRRRRFDWSWHWRALREALRAIGPVLSPEGRLVTLFATPDDAMLESVCLATSSAGFGLRGWGYAPEAGYRLVWEWGEGGGGSRELVDVERLQEAIALAVESAIRQTLLHRGEPTRRRLLHTAAHIAATEQGLLASVAELKHDRSAMAFTAEAIGRGFDSAPAAELADGSRGQEGLWWLVDPQLAVDTLADRVEATLRQLLLEREAWNKRDLTNAVYARFPGELSPDLTLVRVCLESYAVCDGQEACLRSEDDEWRRRVEIDNVREDLAALGEGLGFRAVAGQPWDVRWMEEGRETYVFAILATAAVGAYLLAARAADEGAQRCLVVPGGRAQLIDLKLQRDPRLAQAVDAGAWQFIKFRHLRRLMAKDDLDRYAFRTVLGLDPIAERESAQIPLF